MHDGCDCELDPGIVDTVALLQAEGFVTTDSGDGVSKPADWYESGDALPFKHVVAITTKAAIIEEAERMAEVLGHDWVVESTYDTYSKSVTLLARLLLDEER